MQFKILGGVQVAAGAGTIDLPEGLVTHAVWVLVQAERSLSRSELKELLWEGGQVSNGQVRSLINRMAEPLGNRIIRDGGAVGIEIKDEDYVDLRAFRELVDDAERESQRDLWKAVALYDYGLRLWSEPLLDGLPTTRALETMRMSLLDEYLDAFERAIELHLKVGHHRELARSQQLANLVDEFPHREGLRHTLMMAKVRAGRPGEARRLYEDFSAELEVRQNAAPGPLLQRLHEQIRAGDPALLWSKPPEHPSDEAVREAGGNISQPSTVRMECSLSGGDFHAAPDRAAVTIVKRAARQVARLQHENERYGVRVVRKLAADAGIVRVLEVGAPVPGDFSAHVHLRRVTQGDDIRVVYTQADASVVTHARSLLADERQVDYVLADLRDPRTIIDNPQVQELLLASQPILLMMRSAINYTPREEDPQALLGALVDAVPPGSYVALNIATTEGMNDLVEAQIGGIYDGVDDEPRLVLRTRKEAEAMFAGLDLVAGVSYIQEIWPDRPHLAGLKPDQLGSFRAFGGVGVKR
ncbi:SAM-dependent methyltransferase [Actinoallomurus acanthiterrae]